MNGEPGEGGGGVPRAPRPPWKEFRAALAAAGFRPSRRFGQNFLLDENTALAIVRDACIAPGDFVLEVGTGCGFLTVHLAHAGARLLTVEIDERLAGVAAPFLEPYPAVSLVRADVLAGKHRLAPEVAERLPARGPWHLVSNLPYSVGGPVMALLAARPEPPDSMTVLVQQEVAERVAACPGSGDWGPLTIGLQLVYRARLLRTVAPALFWPRPRVTSAVLRLERRARHPDAAERARIVTLARALFTRRRQTLRRVLADLWGDRAAAQVALAEAGADPGARAETLDLRTLGRLAERARAREERGGAEDRDGRGAGQQ